MHDYGFPAHTLLGAAQYDNFGAATLFCKNNAGTNVQFVTLDFDPLTMVVRACVRVCACARVRPCMGGAPTAITGASSPDFFKPECVRASNR